MSFDAIVLAGGAGRRMGGGDKLAMDVGGSTLLDRVIDGVRAAGARTVVAVGPRRATADADVVWTIEDQPGGGPVPALAAGVAALPAGPDGAVVVLAGDLAFVGHSGLVPRLVAALGDHDAAVAVDVDGRDQHLTAAYRRSALRPSPAAGTPVRALLEGLRVARVPASRAEDTLDCDTPDDVERARRCAG